MVMIFHLLVFAAFAYCTWRIRRTLFRGMKAISSASFRSIIMFALLIAVVSQPAQALLSGTELGLLFGRLSANMLGSVTGTVADILEGVYEAVMAVFGELVCMLVEIFGQHVLDAVAELPEDLVQAAATVTGYLEIANHWAPIAEGAIFFAAYLAFLAIQIPLKLVVKLFIPTVG